MSVFRILHTESSCTLGGQELRIVSESKGMLARGHHVVIAAPAKSELLRLASQEGISCIPIPVGLGGWGRMVPMFLRLITKKRFQIVHTHGSQDSWTASLAARISRENPIVIRARHKSTPISPTLRHDVLYRRLPHAVVTTGECVRRQLIDQNGLDPANVISIPTGVDLQRFRPSARPSGLKESLGVPEGALLVGTMTFLRQEKGVRFLIESMAWLQVEFPHLRCLIVGDGPEYLNLIRLTRERALESVVLFIGMRHDIPALFSLLDVFVLPSLEEGIPQSLTQALAMECPVVASAVGGVPEVVRDGCTGLLVPPGDPRSLAEKIAFLLKHPDQGKQMGQAGRETIQEDYSLEGMLDKTEHLYARLWEKQLNCAA